SRPGVAFGFEGPYFVARGPRPLLGCFVCFDELVRYYWPGWLFRRLELFDGRGRGALGRQSPGFHAARRGNRHVAGTAGRGRLRTEQLLQLIEKFLEDGRQFG